MGCAQDAEGCFFFDSIITAASSYNIGTGGFFSVRGRSLPNFLADFPDKTGGIIVAERRADVLYAVGGICEHVFCHPHFISCDKSGGGYVKLRLESVRELGG